MYYFVLIFHFMKMIYTICYYNIVNFITLAIIIITNHKKIATKNERKKMQLLYLLFMKLQLKS
jgi:hypothetical protein